MEHKSLFVNFIISLMFCLYGVQMLDIKDCGSYFTFDNIVLEGCEESYTSCPLYIGKTMRISFQINTGKPYGPFNIDGDLLNDVAFHVRGGPKFNLSVAPTNPCEVLLCPLDINYSATFSADIYTDTRYQPLLADLKWIIQTADQQDQLMCFQFPVTLQY